MINSLACKSQTLDEFGNHDANAESARMDVEKVIARYQTSLRAFLLSRVRDPSDVDDDLQEFLLKTFWNLRTMKSDEKVKPWLFQTNNNAIMDHYRLAKRDM